MQRPRQTLPATPFSRWNAFSGGTYVDPTGATQSVFEDATGHAVMITTSLCEDACNSRNHAIGHVPMGTGEARLGTALYDELKAACLALLNDPDFSKMPHLCNGRDAANVRIEEMHLQELAQADKRVGALLMQRIEAEHNQRQRVLQDMEASVRAAQRDTRKPTTDALAAQSAMDTSKTATLQRQLIQTRMLEVQEKADAELRGLQRRDAMFAASSEQPRAIGRSSGTPLVARVRHSLSPTCTGRRLSRSWPRC